MGLQDELPPGVEVVNTMPYEGGTLVLGSDGGIFALGGAGYYGSYTQYASESTQGETRDFRGGRIEPADGGGYTIVAASGERYTFAPKTQAQNDQGLAPEALDVAGAVVDAAPDAIGILESTLADWGLPGSLATGLWNTFKTDPDKAILDLQQTPEFKARYPGLDTLRKKGRAISPKQYQDLENQYAERLRSYGIPPGMYDSPDDFAKWIGGEVSVDEVNTRLQAAESAFLNAPPEVTNALKRFYGLSDGDLVAFFIDPEKTSSALEARQRATAAQIGGGAEKAGYQPLTLAEAERLQKAGVTGEQAAERFGALVEGQELLAGLPGELGDQISRDQQIALVGGDQQVQRSLRKKAGERKAVFQEGGQVAAGAGGVSGLARE